MCVYIHTHTHIYVYTHIFYKVKIDKCTWYIDKELKEVWEEEAASEMDISQSITALKNR